MLYLEIFDYEFITVLANRVGFIYISEESIDLQNAYDWQQNQMLNLSRLYYSGGGVLRDSSHAIRSNTRSIYISGITGQGITGHFESNKMTQKYLVTVINPLAPEVQRKRCNWLFENLAKCFVKFYNKTKNRNHLKVVLKTPVSRVVSKNCFLF